MGSLVTETPLSEIMATMEMLGRLNVSRKDLKKWRSASAEEQMRIAYIVRHADLIARKSPWMSGRIDTGLLAWHDPIVITLSQERDLKKYFSRRSGLEIENEKEVLADLRSVEVGTKYSLAIADLKSKTTDTQIRANMPADYRFDESVACAIIAEMIEAHSNGKFVPLLQNGEWNDFYTNNWEISLYFTFHGGTKKWQICFHQPGDAFATMPGRRIFSLTN